MAQATQYGLKEVADVRMYEMTSLLNSENNLGKITVTASGSGYVISLVVDTSTITLGHITDSTTASLVIPKYEFDSLKVSTLEMSAEETSAKGGQGNPELLSWSYGKELTMTIEDALLSMETLSLMYGGSVSNNVVTIDGNTFPQNMLIVGSTLLKPAAGGDDIPFVFIIPKAKPSVSGTLTMQADGDPSTFEMTVKALAQDIAKDSGVESDVLIKFYPIISST